MADALIFLNRSNTDLRSDSLARLVDEVAGDRFVIHRFESRLPQSMASVNDRVGAVMARWSFVRQYLPHPARKVLLRGLQIAFALCHPLRNVLIFRMFRGRQAAYRYEFRVYMAGVDARKIVLLTHSAGGIIGTACAQDPRIDRIVCFGYPFAHPVDGGAPYRTRHLACVGQPMLVMQGRRDVYGNDPEALRQHLPAHCRIVMLDCDHDYDLDASDCHDQVRDTVLDFLGLPQALAPHSFPNSAS